MAEGRLAVVAIGGNSLVVDPQTADPDAQFAAIRETAESIATLIANGWRVVVTHGNGPQVGHVIFAFETAAGAVPPISLALAGAQTQGSIGLTIQQALGNTLRRRGLARPVVTVVTQVVVDASDPAFRRPTKPVGAFLSRYKARRYRAERGWHVAEDSDRGWRRVVPSPRPVEIVELPAVRHLVAAGVVVVAAGGGGVPTIRQSDGLLLPVDAVVDKDRTAALLATDLEADLLLISTAVDRVALNFREPDQIEVGHLTVAEARRHLLAGQFPSGSMGPKIEAAVEFASTTGRSAIITSPGEMMRALHRQAGTWIELSERPAA